MAIKNIETFILLGVIKRDGEYSDSPVKTKLYMRGIVRCILALLTWVLVNAILRIAYIELLRNWFPSLTREFYIFSIYFLGAVMIPVVIKLSIRDSNRNITNIIKYAKKFTKGAQHVGMSLAMLSGVAMMPVFRILPPEVVLLLFPILCLVAWGIGIHSTSQQFYRIHLLKKYCPYLEYPEDRQYDGVWWIPKTPK